GTCKLRATAGSRALAPEVQRRPLGVCPMSGRRGSRTSWGAAGEGPLRHALAGRKEADVCVVGAGIAGLSTAYFLQNAGRHVIVLDAGRIGGGETERTTAHLASALDEGFVKIESLFGEEGARLAAE